MAAPTTFVFKDTDNGSLTPIGGVDYQLLHHLSKQLGFRYRLVIPADKQWGSKSTRGNWTGMIGLLTKNDADIAISSLSITKERNEAVDFSIPYMVQSVAFVTRIPNEKSKMFAIIGPFDLQLWYGIICAYIMLGMILRILTYMEARFEGESRSLALNKIYFFLFRTLLLQGSATRGNSAASGLIICCWFILTLIITRSYSGILTSYMFLPGHHASVDTVEKLIKAVEEGEMHCGTILGTAEYDIMTMNKTTTSNIIGSSVAANSAGEAGILIDQAAGKNFAFIMTSNRLLAEMNHYGSWKLVISRDSFYSVTTAIAFRKNWPYKALFDDAILRTAQSGYVQKWVDNRLEEILREKPEQRRKQGKRELRLDDIQSAFYILLIGNALSFLVLVAEIIQGSRR